MAVEMLNHFQEVSCCFMQHQWPIASAMLQIIGRPMPNCPSIWISSTLQASGRLLEESLALNLPLLLIYGQLAALHCPPAGHPTACWSTPAQPTRVASVS